MFFSLLQIGKNLWSIAKKHPKDLAKYKKDMNIFRDTIWGILERFDSNVDGYQSRYEYFFNSWGMDKSVPPDPEYYLR